MRFLTKVLIEIILSISKALRTTIRILWFFDENTAVIEC